MRIQTRLRTRKPTTSWTKADQEACLRATDTAELLDSYWTNIGDWPAPWQRSAEMHWDLAIKQDELRKRGITVEQHCRSRRGG